MTEPTPVTYLDHTGVPTDVLDVMTPPYRVWDLDKPTPTLTYVDARQVHLTVHQHITVPAAPTPAPVPVGVLELEGPEFTPLPPLPGRRPGIGLEEISAVAFLVFCVTALIVVLMVIEVLVFIAGLVLAGIAGIVLLLLLVSTTGVKCPGIHCFGCKG